MKTADLRSVIKPAVIAAIRDMRRANVAGVYRLTDEGFAVRVEWICADLSTSIERDALRAAKRQLEAAGFEGIDCGRTLYARSL